MIVHFKHVVVRISAPAVAIAANGLAQAVGLRLAVTSLSHAACRPPEAIVAK